MHPFSMTRLLPSALVLTVLVFASHARADNPEANDDLANQLLPLETRSVGLETNPSLFKSVVDEINGFSPEASENSANIDVLGAGFFEGLVDENGDVDLPLGITVFEAMGTTSVGFGGDF